MTKPIKIRFAETEAMRAKLEELSPKELRAIYKSTDAIGFETVSDAFLHGPLHSAITNTSLGEAHLDLIFGLLGEEW